MSLIFLSTSDSFDVYLDIVLIGFRLSSTDRTVREENRKGGVRKKGESVKGRKIPLQLKRLDSRKLTGEDLH